VDDFSGFRGPLCRRLPPGVPRLSRCRASFSRTRRAIAAGTSASFERPGKWDFQSGTRVFGAREILECYVTVRRSAAAREFKPGPRHAQTPRGLRKT
jgi:hypothetical protein